MDKLSIDDPTSIQSPGSGAWRKAPDAKIELPASPPSTMNKFSLQSPNSTAWKPTEFNSPILEHRGSSISEASAEEIKAVEEACAIPEEDEDDDDDEDDTDEDEGDSEKKPNADAIKDTKTKTEKEESDDDDSDASDDSVPVKDAKS